MSAYIKNNILMLNTDAGSGRSPGRFSGMAMTALLLAGSGFALAEPALAQQSAYEFEEITVTARKRAETITEVPMSIDAWQGYKLERLGVENSTDLIGRIPGLSQSSDVLSPGKDFNYLVIRGIGASTSGDPAVPVFIDGVYQPRLALDMDFVDVERVEVLKGPQGTLYGRNTQGGAVSIITRRPDEEFRVKFMAEVDDFPSFKGLASVSGPLSDTLFAAATLQGNFTEGYLKNVGAGTVNQGLIQTNPKQSANDGRDISARLALRFVPSERLEFYLTGDYAEFNGGLGIPGVPTGCKCYTTNNEFLIDATDKNKGVTLNIDLETDFADITSITGHRELSTVLPFDFDGGTDRSPNFHDFRTKQQVTSQELRLTSNDDGPFQWLAGAYYFHEEIDSLRRYSLLDQDVFPNGLIIDAQDAFVDRDGWALFGQVDFEVTDRLVVTGGVRYSSEDVDGRMDYDFTIFDLLGPGADFVFIAEDEEKASFDGATWLGSIRYDVTDDLSAYFTAASGFKAGGFPLAAADPASFTAFDNEESVSYELGFKGAVAGGKLSFDAAAFYIDVSDQQLAAIIEVVLPGTTDPVPVASTANAGKSSVQGFEFSAQYRPTPELQFTTDIGFTDTEFDDYVDAEGVQHAGEPFRFVPKWTASVGADYTIPLRGSSALDDLTLSANYRYVDKYTQGFGVFADPVFSIKSYDIVDVRATLRAGGFDVQFFVENLFDDYIETRVWNSFFILPDGSRSFSTVLPPRRFGMRLKYEM